MAESGEQYRIAPPPWRDSLLLVGLFLLLVSALLFHLASRAMRGHWHQMETSPEVYTQAVFSYMFWGTIGFCALGPGIACTGAWLYRKFRRRRPHTTSHR